MTARMNNLGVDCLEANNLSLAFDLFREALMYSSGDRNHEEAERIYERASAVTPPSLFKDIETEQDLDETGSTAFAYCKGFVVMPFPKAYSESDVVNSAIVSTIVIFNMAVVYHLKALQDENHSYERLIKAQSLYKRCYHLLSHTGVAKQCTRNPLIDVMVMALLNNLAHSSYEVGSFCESKVYFDSLLQFAITVSPFQYHDLPTGIMVEQQKSSFLINIIILQPPKYAAAA
jgi:hypothetical protein